MPYRQRRLGVALSQQRPFQTALPGDQPIGRSRPKLDRASNTLHIQNVYAEPGAPKNKKVVRDIGKAAASLATFLGAKQIEWGNVPEGWAALKQAG